MEDSKAASDWSKKESFSTIIHNILKGFHPIVTSNNLALNIPLQERTEQLGRIVTIFKENIMSGTQGIITGKAKTDLIIPTCVGGSGIGKTTLMYESAQTILKLWKDLAPSQFQKAHLIYLMVDFSRGYSLCDKDQNLSPSKILAIRLAHAYFVVKKRINLDFPFFFSLCFEKIHLFETEDVLRAIHADLKLQTDEPLFVLFHIDEVQSIFNFEEHYKYDSKKRLFKGIIYQACRFFSSGLLIIQPFISGTSYKKVLESKEPSMYTFEFIEAPLLSLGAVFKLIEYYAMQFGADPWEWKKQLPFLQLLGDMGGLPRAVSYLLEECFGMDYSRGKDFFQKISSTLFYPIFLRISDSITNKYGIEGFILKNKKAALQVINHAIKNISVSRDTVLGSVSIEQMELGGHIFLHKIKTDYYFRMPFLFLFIYNEYLHIIPNKLAAVAFNYESELMWKNWESFNAIFQVFMNNLLIYEKGNIDLSFGDFYYKADGNEETKNLCFKLDSLGLVPVVHRFPSNTQQLIHKETGEVIDWTTCQHLLLNAKSAEFGDTVLFREAEKQTSQKYFGRQVNTIIISGQHKLDYNGKDFTLEQALNEHNKALKTAKKEGLPDSCGIITVIFTTQLFPKDKIQFIPNDILIIHQGNFKDYYGPFATRAAFSIAHTLNPNFADIPHLQVLEGVEETAKLIAVERQKRPFTSADDFYNRIKLVKLNEPLSFFPFTSENLLLPFEDTTNQEKDLKK